jgi:hypothetical protein
MAICLRERRSLIETSDQEAEFIASREYPISQADVDYWCDKYNNLRRQMFDALFPVHESESAKWAKRELELAGLFSPESDYEGMLGQALLEHVQLFGAQGHSGFSASMMAAILPKLIQRIPLTPNDHSQYEDVSEMFGHEPGTDFQDTRDSRWFSHDSGRTWYNVDDKMKEKAQENAQEED